MPLSTLPPAASMRAVSPMRSASPFTCGLVTTKSGMLARRPSNMHEERRPSLFLEVIAVARRAPGERRAQRRRSALEIRARAAYAVAVDHYAGVAVGDVLAQHRRHDGLVIDAGIRHQY